MDLWYYASADCSYSDQDKLKSFIYSNINWEELANRREHVYIDLETDSVGKVVQAKVRHGVGGEFEKEALRVLRQVPCWKVFTHTGKVFGWRNIDIRFSEENRKQCFR